MSEDTISFPGGLETLKNPRGSLEPQLALAIGKMFLSADALGLLVDLPCSRRSDSLAGPRAIEAPVGTAGGKHKRKANAL